MNILDKLKLGSKARKEISWPGQPDVKVYIRVLNEEDYLKSTMAADEIMKTVSAANIARYNGEVETQLLYRAITDIETNKALGNITEFRMLLTPEIKAQLADELDVLHTEFSPDPAKMTDQEFDVFFNDVKKNAEIAAGNVSDIFIARKLIIYLAKQLPS